MGMILRIYTLLFSKIISGKEFLRSSCFNGHTIILKTAESSNTCSGWRRNQHAYSFPTNEFKQTQGSKKNACLIYPHSLKQANHMLFWNTAQSLSRSSTVVNNPQAPRTRWWPPITNRETESPVQQEKYNRPPPAFGHLNFEKPPSLTSSNTQEWQHVICE